MTPAAPDAPKPQPGAATIGVGGGMAEEIERACDAFIDGWREGRSRTVEDVLAGFPGLAAEDRAVLDLIACEVALRVEAGETPTAEDFEARFPRLGEAIRRQFSLEELLQEEGTWDRRTDLDPGPDGTEATRFDDASAVAEGPPPHPPGFVLEAEVGRGGVGVVYRARQSGLRRTVALKWILSGASASRDEEARFLTEAEAVARIQHPNVVQVFDSGSHEGRPFLVMEYASRGSLAGQLDGTPWPPRSAARLVHDLALGMAEAHRLGIIHRDLKPSNVLIVADGTPKVADFGLARLIDSDSQLTRTGALMGSPSYMAPEQASEGTAPVGTAADIHALGAILYELLTGRPPFRGTSVIQTLQLVRTAEPVPPSRLVPGISRDVETITLTCLHKEPHRRYGSADALARDLDSFLEGRPIAARAVGPMERAWRWAGRHRLAAGLVVALAATIVGGLAGLTSLWARAEGHARDARDRGRVAQENEHLARRRSVALALDKGQALAERGLIARGLLWMAEAERIAPTDAADLRAAAWANIDAWATVVPAVRAILPQTNVVNRIEIGPDGRTGLVVCGDETSRIYDLSTGKLNHELAAGSERNTANISRDGTRAVVIGRDSVRTQVLDVASGKLLLNVNLDGQASFCLFVRSATQLMAFGAYNSLVQLYDARDGRRLPLAEVQDGRLLGDPDASADGMFAISRHESGLRWRDLRGAETSTLIASPPATQSLTRFTPDGRRFACWDWDARTRSGSLRVWETARPTQPKLRLSSPSPASALSFRADGEAMVLGGEDGTMQVLDVATGQPLGPAILHDSAVRIASFSPDGQTLLTAHADDTARCWDVATGRPLGVILEHEARITAARFLGDGRTVVTGGFDRSVRTWDVAAALAPGGLLPDRGTVTSAELAPDSRSVVLLDRDAGEARVLDSENGQPTIPPLHHPSPRSAHFNADGRLLATTGDDRQARIWDTREGRLVVPPLNHGGWILDSRFSPDGSRLLTACTNGLAYLWDASTGRNITPPRAGIQYLEAKQLAFPDDDRAISTDSVGVVTFWDARTGRVRATLRDFAGPLTPSPDGRTAYSIVKGRVQAIDVDRALPRNPPFGDSVRTMALSRDGQVILTGGSDRSARLWKAESGQRLGPSLEHPAIVVAVAFGRDETRLVTAAADGRIRFWDRATGHRIGPAYHHGPGLNGIAVSEDGKTVFGFGDSVTSWSAPGVLQDRESSPAGLARIRTAMTLNSDGGAQPLGAEDWRTLAAQSGQAGAFAPLPDAEWHERLASRHEMAGAWQASLWHLDRLIAIRPGEWWHFARRALVRAELRDSPGATADEARAAAIGPPQRVNAHLLTLARSRLTAAVSSRDWRTALTQLDAILAHYPDDFDLLKHRARIRAFTGDLSGALADFGQAANSPMSNVDFYRLALLQIANGKFDDYRSLCRELLARHPNPTAQDANSIAWICSLAPDAVDEPANLARIAHNAVERADRSARLIMMNTLGATLYRAGRYAEALAALNTSATSPGGGFPQDWAFQAMVLHRMNATATARLALERLNAWCTLRELDLVWEDLEIKILRDEVHRIFSETPIELPDDVFAPTQDDQ